MRYIMYGAGAIGGLLGAQLYRAGFDVVLIARGEHLKAIQNNGLCIKNPAGSATLPLAAVAHPEEIEFRTDDVVFLTMKTQDTESALTDLEAATGGADLPIVCAQNGLENERLALRRFPRVYAMVLFFIGSYLEPGVIEAGEPITGIVDGGRYPSGVDDLITRVTEDLSKAGLSSVAQERIMRWKYAKLLSIIGNTAQAIVGRENARELTRLCVEEGAACFKAAGFEWATEEEMRARREGVTQSRSDLPGTSVWQSLARGSGSIESDYLNGELVLLGRLHGVPTPANEALQRLGRRMVAENIAPGSISPADVMREIEAANG
jgi:2-dehydropantoate 2-reductase